MQSHDVFYLVGLEYFITLKCEYTYIYKLLYNLQSKENITYILHIGSKCACFFDDVLYYTGGPLIGRNSL